MREPVFLFDIGNVLIDFDLPGLLNKIVLASNAGLPALHRMWESYLFDVETGKLDDRHFFEAMAQEIELPWDYEQWVGQWMEVYEIDRVGHGLFSKLREKGHRVSMLSNLAPYNTAAIEKKFPKFFEYGCRPFFSYELGYLKPDARIYQAACEALQTTPEQCVFIDDLAENVAGARAVGMTALQFSREQPEDVIQYLEGYLE